MSFPVAFIPVSPPPRHVGPPARCFASLSSSDSRFLSVTNDLSDVYFCVSDLISLFPPSPRFHCLPPPPPLPTVFSFTCDLLGTFGPWHLSSTPLLLFLSPLPFSNTRGRWFRYPSATLGCRCVTFSLAALALPVLSALWLS